MKKLAEVCAAADGYEIAESDVRWSVFRDAPDLGRELDARLPHVAAAARSLGEGVPIQRTWRFGETGAFVRPDRHVRAFYVDLAKLDAGPGVIAVKGSEVLADNFELLIERLRSMWSVFTWSIGGPERHIIDDVSLMDQLERFPVTEGKPPGAHPLFDALEEADTSASLQAAHLERYGELAHAPFPLLVCKWPDEVRDRLLGRFDQLLSRKARHIVQAELAGGLGTYVYYYPVVPLRVMHLRIPDASSASGIPFGERLARLGELTDVDAAIEGWIRTASRMVALGYVPTDPANLGRGNCVMPQNLVLDGGIVDLDSLRLARDFRTEGELAFALEKSVRVLSQAISWFLVGTAAGLLRFERLTSEVHAHVWTAHRELVAREARSEPIASLYAAKPTAQALRDCFERLLALGQFRPGDGEQTRFKR